ncbi:helix-turn-helix domain-containing protein [Methylobacterium sp. E-005]|uniref:helix-turn-helix domain-containing protein n=1 Tax=Methylobacterium sp. E-005 TaxID=2836549 RepID=UPI001FBA67A5|nr:helix-turn-helix domain-containing protein [Methylobacterium sp. E-005]MCJ2086508.1 helix-turn-helix domain-containing protein [Methylobacterium sp. E-005]
MRTFTTSGQVIDALGGTAELAKALGRKMTVISNWRTGGAFPANTYLVLTDLLQKVDSRAPAHLWNMVDAPMRAAEPQRATA